MSKDIKKPAGETRRYVGIDLGDKKSRVCILDERGEIVLQEWVVTTPEAFFKRFHGETKMDIAMEVGAHSRWASDLLRSVGLSPTPQSICGSGSAYPLAAAFLSA